MARLLGRSWRVLSAMSRQMLDHRIPDKLHVRMRLGIVGGGISGDDVEWDDWTNPLAGDNTFDLHPRVLDDHGAHRPTDSSLKTA